MPTLTSMKTRFSHEQLRSLETAFTAEERPDSGMKLGLAKKLGLETRQVAIWFQNQRARSKGRQMERDLDVLKSNYDHLVLGFQDLRKENQLLLLQVQRLREMEEDDSKNHRTSGARENPGFLGEPSSEMVEAKYHLDAGCYLHEGSFGDGCSFQTHDSQWWDF